MEQKLCKAVARGDVDMVRKYLKHKSINVNSRHQGLTPLGVAIVRGNIRVVAALLKHPDVNINGVGYENFDNPIYSGQINKTALMLAYTCKQTAIFDLLLPLPANNVLAVVFESNIFSYAVHNSDVLTLEKLLAYHGHVVTEQTLKRIFSTIGLQRISNKGKQARELLTRFQQQPKLVIRQLQLKHGFVLLEAAKFLALTIAVTDDWLRPHQALIIYDTKLRFLKICKRLPDELKTIVCRRAVGLKPAANNRDYISDQELYDAFRLVIWLIYC